MMEIEEFCRPNRIQEALKHLEFWVCGLKTSGIHNPWVQQRKLSSIPVYKELGLGYTIAENA